ncbi:MAG TPA: hypothetical protein VF658_21910 [Pyrinomonadaceae bacterium]|jgi:hypothetical protein
MPHVKGPLFSMEASGTLGGTITFDKRGFVRQRVIPANPQTPAQGNQRQVLLAAQKALTRLNATAIAAVRAIAPTSYRWNSFLLQQVIGPGSSEFEASRAAYAAMGAEPREGWEDQAVAMGLTAQSLPYASDFAITPGLALFAVSRALFRLGLNAEDGVPGPANAPAWRSWVGD